MISAIGDGETRSSSTGGSTPYIYSPRAGSARLLFRAFYLCKSERERESHRMLVIHCKYYYWHFDPVKARENQNISLEKHTPALSHRPLNAKINIFEEMG